jgi:dihydropyrimidine dehydrogenase (NAD+) subunit PreA
MVVIMNEQLTLKVQFAGVEFKNPFLLASAPPTMDADHIISAANRGWAGAVTKTIGMQGTTDVKPRFASLRVGKKSIGMENIELISDKAIDVWCDYEIPKIKAEAPSEFVLVASIMALPERKEWAELAKRVAEAGVDLIELNVSCPHGMPERKMGMFIGQDPELTGMVTKSVKTAVNLPVMVKLTPNVTDIKSIAIAAERAGANALSAINTVAAVVGIDLELEVPLPNVQFKSAIGGLSGPAIRPIALRCVCELALASTLPISGIGGITDWQSAVEFILAGASTLQLCTAPMWYGYGIIDDLCTGLLNYMKHKRYNTISDFCGNALKNLVVHSALQVRTDVYAEIDSNRCNGCGLCVIACRDGGFNAITLSDKKLAVVDRTRCDACGLCAVVCNFNAVRVVASSNNNG